jgi:hypothetical protein
VNPGLPGFDNSFAPFFTGQVATNVTAGNLGQLLINLQADLTQIWPVLAAVNDSFVLQAAGTNGLGVVTNGASNTTRTAPGNFSTLLGNNSSANLGTSLGQDLSSITGGRATALTPSGPALGNNGAALTPTGVTNPSGLQPGFATNLNGFASNRDVIRALMTLQSEVEMMLPLVNALNGGNATNLGLVFGSGANGVQGTGTVPALTPTGR